jgi:plexin A
MTVSLIIILIWHRASKESDMRVLIGAQICNVTSLSANQLTCKPPESQPAALINGREDYDELPEVVVLIGDSLQYKIGKLSYSTGKLFEAITQRH